MEKIYANILSLIISCFVAYTLIIPASHIFGLEDSTDVNGSVRSTQYTQSDATIEQTSKDNAQDGGAISKEDLQKADDTNIVQAASKQTEQTVLIKQTAKDSSNTHSAHLAIQTKHTAKDSSRMIRPPPRR